MIRIFALLAALAGVVHAQKREVGQLVYDGVPDVPRRIGERAQQYQSARGAIFLDWDPAGGMLIATTRARDFIEFCKSLREDPQLNEKPAWLKGSAVYHTIVGTPTRHRVQANRCHPRAGGDPFIAYTNTIKKPLCYSLASLNNGFPPSRE